MKIYTKYFVLFIFTVALLACGSKTTTTNTTNSGTTKSTNTSAGKSDTNHTIEFAISEVYYKSTPNNCTKNDSNCTYIEIIFSKLLQGPAMDKINKMMLDTTLRYSYTSDTVIGSLTPNMVLDSFIADFNEEQVMRGPDAYFIPWALETNTSIPYHNSAVVSYQIFSYSFLGGAHPSTNNWYYNFDWNTGNLLKITDVLKPGFEKKLNELIVADFRKQKNMKPNEPLNSILFENTLTYTNNFAIAQGKLVFIYNPYDIAAYVYGPTVIEIPVSAIQDYIINPAMFQ